jgi:hypothetical protein
MLGVVIASVVQVNGAEVFVFVFDGWLRGEPTIGVVVRIVIVSSNASASNRYAVGEEAARSAVAAWL